jgi:hypothetical protein
MSEILSAARCVARWYSRRHFAFRLSICWLLFAAVPVAMVDSSAHVYGQSPLSGGLTDEDKTADEAEMPEEPVEPEGTETPTTQSDRLPRFEEMVIPSAETLLRGKPVDWLVLYTGEVIVVQPVDPRPETLVTLLETQQAEMRKQLPNDIGLAAIERQRRRDLGYLPVTVLNDDVDPEYRIELKRIDRIIHHEDMMVMRANLLIDEQQFPIAYELLHVLNQSRPKWPRSEQTRQRLLWVEGELAGSLGNRLQALTKLEELWVRNPDYEGLKRVLGEQIEAEVRSRMQQQDFRQARYFIGRLQKRYPDHGVVQKLGGQLEQQAEQTIAQARQVSPAEASELVDRAAVIWPKAPSLKVAHRELIDQFQILRVGVTALAGAERQNNMTQLVPPTAAQDRGVELTQLPLFEVTRIEPGGTYYRSRWFTDWEPLDLGREMRLVQKSYRSNWESRPQMTASDLSNTILAKVTPGSVIYDSRLAGYIGRAQVSGPGELRISFDVVPLRPEGLLRTGVLAQAGGPDGDTLTPLTRDIRFVERSRSDSQVVFERSRPVPANARKRGIERIVETRYPSWDAALRGLIRGEETLLPVVDPRDLDKLKDDKRFMLFPYAQPAVHIVLFSPRSVPCQNGTLRGALLAGIDRENSLRVKENDSIRTDQISAIKEGYFQGVGLATAKSIWRPVNGPFSSNTYAYSRNLPVSTYQPELSAALALTAKKDLGGEIPPLRLFVQNEPRLVMAADELITRWQRLGIPVSRQTNIDEASKCDLIYRVVRLQEPLYDLWPCLTNTPTAEVEDLAGFPGWLRNRLLDLELVGDWDSAVRQLVRLQADLLADARYLPLWEIDEFMVARKRLSDVPPKLLSPYHEIERWTLQSWYPTETPP